MDKPCFLSQPVQDAVFLLLEDLASPRALSVKMLIDHGEWDQLASLQVDPLRYLDSHSYWADAQASDLLRKLPELPTTIDRKAVAEETFVKCELENLRSNIRLYPLLEGASSSPYDAGVHAFVDRARKAIADILGPCPTVLDGRFGPGTTFGDRGGKATIPHKMSSEPTFTSDVWPFLFQWSGTLWARACSESGRLPKSIRGNRFLTVPKDATKDRGIAVEPSINIFYQKAYGRLIRSRLSRHGINLDEGQDKHRALAMCASTEGSLATLDLSNASDTICRNLVKLLLPSSWFEWLDALRSKRTLFQGSFRILEKFSSMGNGFTFELETLIFIGLLAAITGSDSIGKTIFAYGDDLIFPAVYSKDVISALAFFGLTVNKRKTFVDGPFRESCGGDYFDGAPVRAFFLKESPCEPQQLMAFYNGLLRSSAGFRQREEIVRRSMHTIQSGLPTRLRCLFGPQALGDICLHSADELSWRIRWKHCIRSVRVYKPARYRKIPWSTFSPSVILASACYGVPWNEGYILPRDSVTGHEIGWVAYS